MKRSRMMCRLAMALAAAWLAGPGVLSAQPAAAAEAAPDASIRAGRDSLGRYWPYPWYDAKADALRDVDPPDPPKPPESNSAWFKWFDWSGLGAMARLGAWTCLLLLLMAIFYFLARYFRDREMAEDDEAEKAGDAARIESLPFAVRPGRLDLLEEARRCYQQGDYRHAIIYLFSYELVELDRNQLIRLAKGKTNRQYLREIRTRRPLRDLVEQTMTAFEDVFFGNHDLSREQFEACWRRVDDFLSLAAPEKAHGTALVQEGAPA